MNAAPQLKKHFSYADYLNWPADERWEIIEGEAFNMSPAPTPQHQKVSFALSRIIADYLDDKTCELYPAPFDVKLSDEKLDELVDTVVQPDISVICDQSRLDERGYNGAPTLIVEILSKSTASKDLSDKFFLYEKHGVKVYLIVNPWAETITVHQLGPEGKFIHPQTYAKGDDMPLEIFPGFSLNVDKVFA